MNLPKEITKLLTVINSEARALIVGGYIRDYTLGIVSKDIDIEVYDVSYSRLKELISGYKYSEISNFNIILIVLGEYDIELTLPRVENKRGKKHNDFSTLFMPTLDYKVAFSRRDFTINSIGYDTKGKEIIDIYGGLKDIQKKVIRHVNSQTFCEDPLRVLRAVRFSTRLGFSVAKVTMQLCVSMVRAGDMHFLAKERIFSEVSSTLLYPNRAVSIVLYRRLGLLADEPLSAPKYKKVLKRIRDIKSPTIEALLAILFYYTKESKLLEQICYSRRLYSKVQNLIHYTKVAKRLTLTQANINRLSTKTDIVTISHILSDKRLDQTINIKPLIDGNLLKKYLKPSKKYKFILSQIYKKQLNGTIKTEEEALLFLKNYLKK